MDISQFVNDALLGILGGVAKAQQDDAVGKQIVPTFRFAMGGNTDVRGVFAHGSNNYTVVEFDVAVTSETTGDAKGHVKVLGVASANLNAEHSRGTISRIKFSVPVLLSQVEGS